MSQLDQQYPESYVSSYDEQETFDTDEVAGSQGCPSAGGGMQLYSISYTDTFVTDYAYDYADAEIAEVTFDDTALVVEETDDTVSGIDLLSDASLFVSDDFMSGGSQYSGDNEDLEFYWENDCSDPLAYAVDCWDGQTYDKPVEELGDNVICIDPYLQPVNSEAMWLSESWVA